MSTVYMVIRASRKMLINKTLILMIKQIRTEVDCIAQILAAANVESRWCNFYVFFMFRYETIVCLTKGCLIKYKPLPLNMRILAATATNALGVPYHLPFAFACPQGQGALSERLRSFSMQDLSVIQRDASPPGVSPGVTRSATGHPRARMSARSNSEAAASKSKDPPKP